jgi:hypothetical protein
MKEYQFNLLYRGFQIDVFLVCKGNKEARKIAGITDYFIKNYCFVNYPKTVECIKNPDILFAMFERYGGESSYFLHKDKRIEVLSLDIVKSIIDNHRINNPTYRDTIKNFKQ